MNIKNIANRVVRLIIGIIITMIILNLYIANEADKDAYLRYRKYIIIVAVLSASSILISY